MTRTAYLGKWILRGAVLCVLSASVLACDDVQRAEKQSRFASAVANMSYVKIRATEYYFLEEKWPASLADLEITYKDLPEPSLVKSVELQDDGTIDMDVSPAFGEGARILLVPETRGGSPAWTCRTNVPQPQTTGDCASL